MPFKRNIKSKEMNNEKINSKTFSESRWSVMNFLRSLDIFGQPIPAFNIKGKE